MNWEKVTWGKVMAATEVSLIPTVSKVPGDIKGVLEGVLQTRKVFWKNYLKIF